jgi:dTDP-4-amino-4,6-dideoxygalactose transaminase
MNIYSRAENSFSTKIEIPFTVPSIGEEEIQEVISTLRTGCLTTGPRTRRFEEEFAKYIGAKHAIAVSSGTAALHLALLANRIGPGDEVITTPYTSVATGEAILHTGAKMVLADIARDEFNIDPEKINDSITPNTKAIVPVHFAGMPCNMDAIMGLANLYGLNVIEDAAHALGASYKEENIGIIGTTTCFSFNPVTNLTTGEGGMVTTEDDQIAESLRVLSLHGLSQNKSIQKSQKRNWFYEIIDLGFKYNMTDIQAAIGLQQLKRLDYFQFRRREIIENYHLVLSAIEELILPIEPVWAQSSWHLFVIKLNYDRFSIERNQMVNDLQENGINCRVHFIPLHLQPYYQKRFGYQFGDFPNAEDTYSAAISLPLYPKMSLESVIYISKVIKSIIAKTRYKNTVYVEDSKPISAE